MAPEHRFDRGEHAGDRRRRSMRPPIRNAISGSARGWISSSSGTGSPGASSMPVVSRPYTGSRMPSASRLTLLVSPAWRRPPPRHRRAGASRQPLRRVAVSASRKGYACVNGVSGFRVRSAAIKGSAILRASVMKHHRTGESHGHVAEMGELGPEHSRRGGPAPCGAEPRAARCRRGADPLPELAELVGQPRHAVAGLPEGGRAGATVDRCAVAGEQHPEQPQVHRGRPGSAGRRAPPGRTRRCPRRCRRADPPVGDPAVDDLDGGQHARRSRPARRPW